MSKIRWEIEEAVNGFRVNIYSKDFHELAHKENCETRLEALSIILESIKKEVAIEYEVLKQAAFKLV